MPLGHFGDLGILGVPSARFFDTSRIAAGSVIADGYARDFFTVQMAPMVAATVTRETRRPTGDATRRPAEVTLDLRLRLLPETRRWPAVAIGLRDLDGGRFGAEYVVASKRFGPFDLATGLGWGRLGEAAQMANPLGLVSTHFVDHRPQVQDQDPWNAWFTGADVGLFAGLAYRTPLSGLTAALAYGSDRNQGDAQVGARPVHSLPIDLGLSYRPWSWLDLGLGYEAGRLWSGRVALIATPGQLDGLRAVGPVPVRLGRFRPARPHSLGLLLTIPGVTVHGYHVHKHTATLRVDLRGDTLGSSAQTTRIMGHLLRSLAHLAPPDVEELVLLVSTRGLKGLRVAVLRTDLVAAATGRGSIEELWHNAEIQSVAGFPDLPNGGFRDRSPFSSQPILTFRQSLGDRLGQPIFRATFDQTVQATLGLGFLIGGTIRSELGSTLLGQDGGFPAPFDAVRSDEAAYAVQSSAIPRLHRAYVAWLHSPAVGVHTKVMVGYLEEMFAGLDTSLLVRPPWASWAGALQIARVVKRVPGPSLAIYSGTGRTTGFLTAYRDWPARRLNGRLAVGRFLGGDLGISAGLSHHADGGVRLAGTVTVSDRGQFGRAARGLRDPAVTAGLRLTIPIGRLGFLTDTAQLEIGVEPLARDRGQRLSDPLPLYSVSHPLMPSRLSRTWRHLID